MFHKQNFLYSFKWVYVMSDLYITLLFDFNNIEALFTFEIEP